MKYNRDLFEYNGPKARRHLKASSGGIYLDVYNGRIVQDFDAEHVFPLKSAWDCGFSTLYSVNEVRALQQMKAFANDPKNLVIAGSSSNRSRGHKTLWNWCPLNLAWIPERNRIVRELAKDYDLTLTAPQKWAMDWADYKITKKYKHGILLGKTRAWLTQHGFHKWLMPF